MRKYINGSTFEEQSRIKKQKNSALAAPFRRSCFQMFVFRKRNGDDYIGGNENYFARLNAGPLSGHFRMC